MSDVKVLCPGINYSIKVRWIIIIIIIIPGPISRVVWKWKWRKRKEKEIRRPRRQLRLIGRRHSVTRSMKNLDKIRVGFSLLMKVKRERESSTIFPILYTNIYIYILRDVIHKTNLTHSIKKKSKEKKKKKKTLNNNKKKKEESEEDGCSRRR